MCHTLANTHTHIHVCVRVSFYELFGLQAGRAPYTFPFSADCGLLLPASFLYTFIFFFSASSCFCWGQTKAQPPTHTFMHRHFPFADTHTHTHPQLQRPNPFDVAFIALACFFVCRLCRKGSEKDFRVVQTILPHLKLICALTLYDFSGTQMVRQIPKNRFTFLFLFGLLVWVLYSSLGLF